MGRENPDGVQQAGGWFDQVACLDFLAGQAVGKDQPVLGVEDAQAGGGVQAFATDGGNTTFPKDHCAVHRSGRKVAGLRLLNQDIAGKRGMILGLCRRRQQQARCQQQGNGWGESWSMAACHGVYPEAV